MERREVRERGFEEGMRKRHHIAMTGVRLERMAWEEGMKATFSEMRLFISEQHLPENAQEKLLTVVHDFEAQERALDTMQLQLEQTMGFRIQDEPERAGKLYFKTANEYHLEPKGKITLMRERGYFKLSFEQTEDFDEMHPLSENAADGCAGVGIFELTPNLLDPTYKRRYEDRLYYMPGRAFGLYSDEKIAQLKAEGLALPSEVIFRGEMPIVSIKGDSAFQRSLIEHERQHIIYKSFENNADPFDGIRNELLAKIRGGTWRGAEFLDSPLYKGLTYDLHEDKRAEARTLLDDIQEQLHRLPTIFGQHASRALLTYHLIDLPLEQMPERIKSLAKFYTPYLKPFAEYQPPDAWADQHVTMVGDIRYGFVTFADAVQPFAEQVVATYDAWMNGFDDAVYTALTHVEGSHTQLGIDNVRRLRDAALDALRVLLEKSNAPDLHAR